MSTLEKTINLVIAERSFDTESLDDIFENIVGAIPDTGKSLEEYGYGS